ncbi:DNA polymerase III subunit beta [Candidatus Kaiserbacteria bacterium]|nr:DNA polymerase III subunit beta [Candidatus Kaiserbacteria bacterium]
MRVFVEKQRLQESISLAARVVGKKESLPVLSCVLCEATKNELVIRATNLESAIDIRIPARVERVGVCAIPAQIFIQTVRALRADHITLTYENRHVVCTTGGSTTSINSIPHEEFPTIPKPTDGVRFSLPHNIFLEGIRSVAYAASPSTIRQEFASVFLTYKDGAMVFVATDSFRLAEKKIHTPIKKEPEDILIPVKNALDLVYVFERGGEEEIICTVADSQLHASLGPVSFVSRVVDASFPDYEAIIPKKTTTESVVLKEDLAVILQKATIFSGDARQVGFHAYPKRKIFSASAQNTTIGEMSDTIDAAITGDDIDINFNIPFVSDCLQSIGSDSLQLKFAGPGKPLVIEGISDKTFRYLVMPLNR